MKDISYQLYSSREFPPLAATCRMLADLGYSQVEAYGALFDDVPALHKAATDAGLSVPSGHFALAMLEEDPDRVFHIIDTLQLEAIYCPFLVPSERPRGAAGWQAFGERLQRAGKPFVDRGILFGWHNHDFEFIADEDGSIPMESIFNGAPDISWEADLAWIVRGGADPFDWIARHGARISAVHVKDIAPEGDCEDEDGWSDVGHGTMNWTALLQSLGQTPVRHLIMEHDKPNDHRRFAERSIASVKSALEA